MNAPVNRNLIDAAGVTPPPAARNKRPRWFVIGVSVILFGLAVLALLVWFFRRTLAENAVDRWCTTQGLTCDGTAERVGPRAIRLTRVDVRRGEAPAFAADAIEARLSWSSLFSPSPSLIIVERPVLNGKLDKTGVTFSGLEKLLDRPSTGGAPPSLDIRDARLVLQTPYGELAASANVKGRFPADATIDAVIEPGVFSGADGNGEIQAVSLNLRTKDGVLQGPARLAGSFQTGDALKIEGAQLNTTLSIPMDATAPVKADWSGTFVSLSIPALYAEKVDTKGSLRFTHRPTGDGTQLFGAVDAIETETRAAFAKRETMTLESVRLKTSAVRKDGALSGPLTLTLGGFSTPDLSTGTLTADGKVQARSPNEVAFSGEASLSGARLGDGPRGAVLKAVALPDIFARHQAAGRAALGQALTNFAVAAPLAVSVKDNKLRVAAIGETRLKAASGLDLVLKPVAEGEAQPVFTLDGQTRRIEATIEAAGGGLPDIKLEAASLLSEGNQFDLAAAGGRIAPWRAGEQSVSAATGPIIVRLDGATLEAETTGTLEAAGKFAGLNFKPTEIDFAIATERKSGVWTARSPDKSCFEMRSGGFDFGTVAAGAFATRACGQDGYLLDPKSKTPRGDFALDPISLPFSTSNASGTLNMDGAALAFSGGKDTSITLTGETFGLPMMIGERTLTISAQLPKLEMRSAGGAPAIVLALGQTQFGGNMVPANVEAETVVFTGTAPKSGLEGALDASTIRIRDNRADPLYQPLIADFAGRMSEDRLTGRAPLRLAASGIPVAVADLSLDYLKLNGTARVETLPLEFKSRGLQPVMLTEQLRGVFTAATGALNAQSDITITNGKLAGTADIALTDFGFQTQRFGRVEDIDGTVRFSDIFELTTEKNQRVTIGSINPGIPLEDGEFFFSLTGGKTYRLTGGAFPFAGGRIELGPIDWTMGDRNQRAEVSVINVDMAELIETLKIPDVKATGKLSGAFPLRIEGQKLLVDNARLAASGAGGKLIYEGKALDNVATSPELKMVNGALRDFDYRVIELGLDGDLAGRAKITARLIGSNAGEVEAGPRMTLLPGQTFDLALTFNSELGQLINMAGQKYVLEQVKALAIDEIRRDAPPPPPQSE